VIPAGFDYLRPATISEALEMIRRDEEATFLAGGHALLPDAKLGRTSPATLIDLGRIDELRGIVAFGGDGRPPGHDNEAGGVHVGAMTTSAEIEHSTEIARTAPLLSKAAAVISDPLIRNRATLGGSLAEADPHGDWPPVVLAADATIHLRSPDTERAIPARDFFRMNGTGPGTGSTDLRRGELLTAVTVPAVAARSRSIYLKRMHPASGHAMIGVAATAVFDADEICRDCRIAITGVGSVATRTLRAEAELVGSHLTPEAIKNSANAANEEVVFVGDAFGSAAYLAQLLPTYVTRALTQIATHPQVM
jgi:aerobic carbon-monoxide dehydrogenase medium subunit